MPRGQMATGGRLVYGVVRGSPISRRDRLRASHMHGWVAGDLATESQNASAMMASLVSDRAERMALVMVARTAARSVRSSGRWNSDDAHYVILSFCYARQANRRKLTPVTKLLVAILPLTVCTSFPTKSYNDSWRG